MPVFSFLLGKQKFTSLSNHSRCCLTLDKSRLMIWFFVVVTRISQAPNLAKKCIVHYTTEDQHKRANAAMLIGSYAVSLLGGGIFYHFCFVFFYPVFLFALPRQRSLKLNTFLVWWYAAFLSAFSLLPSARWMNNVVSPQAKRGMHA